MNSQFILAFILIYSQICMGQGYDFSKKKIVLQDIDSTDCIVFVNDNALIYVEKQTFINELSEIKWSSNGSENERFISIINRPGKLYLTMNYDINKDSILNERIPYYLGNNSLTANIFLTKVLLKGNCIVLKRNKKLSSTKILIAKIKQPGTIEFYFPNFGKLIHTEIFAL